MGKANVEFNREQYIVSRSVNKDEVLAPVVVRPSTGQILAEQKSHFSLSLKVPTCADHILAMGPYRFFVTLTFQVKVSKREALAYASTVQRRCQRNLFGKRWKKSGVRSIQGVAIMEQASIICSKPEGSQKRPFIDVDLDNFHFHILIKQHPLWTSNDEDILADVCKAYGDAITALHKQGTRQSLISSMDGVKVSLVHDQEGICSYCAKASHNPYWQWNDWVYFLSENGMD